MDHVDRQPTDDSRRSSLDRDEVKIDLWIDGNEIGDCAGWSEEIKFNFDRFREDDHYAALISDHISMVLEQLAREVEWLGVVSTPIGSS